MPNCDVLCRFIRPRDWSNRENRPRPGAFKQPDLSVWHKDKLEDKDVQLAELRIEHLAGWGQAHYTAGDFLRLAKETSESEGNDFQVIVEWRPDDEFVEEPWRKWRYAHVQVEAVLGPQNFLTEFRRRLSLEARTAIPPDGV